MSNYGYTNADGEPIMDGAAYRYEQYLDSMYEPDPDDFYRDSYNADDACEGGCGNEGFDFVGDRWLCDECADSLDADEDYEGGEDAYLDSYMEDRISEMYL